MINFTAQDGYDLANTICSGFEADLDVLNGKHPEATAANIKDWTFMYFDNRLEGLMAYKAFAEIEPQTAYLHGEHCWSVEGSDEERWEWDWIVAVPIHYETVVNKYKGGAQ